MFSDFLKFINCCQENKADNNTEETFKKGGIMSQEDQYKSKGQIRGKQQLRSNQKNPNLAKVTKNSNQTIIFPLKQMTKEEEGGSQRNNLKKLTKSPAHHCIENKAMAKISEKQLLQDELQDKVQP